VASKISVSRSPSTRGRVVGRFKEGALMSHLASGPVTKPK
jgi:hypothetical protein